MLNKILAAANQVDQGELKLALAVRGLNNTRDA